MKVHEPEAKTGTGSSVSGHFGPKNVKNAIKVPQNGLKRPYLLALVVERR